jgi:hypothetical protein
LLAYKTIGTAARVTPIGSSGYVANPPGFSGPALEYTFLALREAILYMNRLTSGPVRFGAGAAPRVPEMLVYLLYHAGAYFPGVLASAVAQAVRSASHPSASQAARDLARAVPDSYRDPTSVAGTLLKDIRRATNKDVSAAKASSNWLALTNGDPGFGKVLGAPAALDALNTYIRDTGETAWTSWAYTNYQGVVESSFRPNVVSYNNLYQYFLSLINSP